MKPHWQLRLARIADIDALRELIPLSALALLADYYSREQVEAAFGPVFGVDRQLIEDGTYFVATAEEKIVGCGGWSKRLALFGGDAGRPVTAAELDPQIEPARVRAFFVHPDWARQGIGRAILLACEDAIRAAGFRRIELVATLGGEPLYRACGYQEIERLEIEMERGLRLPGVRMGKAIEPA